MCQAGLAGAGDQSGLDLLKCRLQLTQKVPVDRGLNTDKFSVTCSAMPCYSLFTDTKKNLTNVQTEIGSVKWVGPPTTQPPDNFFLTVQVKFG